MSVHATVRGLVLGALAALVGALVLASAAYHTDLAGPLMAAGIWLMDAVVSFVAGFMAGRRTENGAILHGFLAAVTLAVLGSLLAEVGHWPIGPLWGRLALAAIMGMTGGIAAVIL
ncbi:MAG: TIGR04086 family membrane protein [Clostridia bacterium]